MNKKLCDTIEANIARLTEMRSIIQREPAFARWRPIGGDFNPFWLAQLWPDCTLEKDSSYPIHDRQRDAKAIARALGGRWRRRTDGSWETQGESNVGYIHIVLHHVDFDKPPGAKPEDVIDLDAPEPEDPGDVTGEASDEHDDVMDGVRAEERP